MTMQIILCVLTVIAAVAFITTRTTVGGAWGILTKTIASVMFVAYGVFSLVQVTYFKPLALAFIILGLIFGMIGDVVLDLKVVYKEHQSIYLNAGMLSFGLGHICYMLGAIFIAGNVFNLMWPVLTGVIAAVVLTPIIWVVSKYVLKLNFGKFLWQTLAYTFILVFMVGFSIYLAVLAQEFIIFAGGIILIFLSDLVLSQNYFLEGKENDKFLIIVNHALYYAGQILMATFLYLF